MYMTLNTINGAGLAFSHVCLMFLESHGLRFFIMCQPKSDPQVMWHLLCGGTSQCWIGICVYHNNTKQIHDGFFPKKEVVIFLIKKKTIIISKEDHAHMIYGLAECNQGAL